MDATSDYQCDASIGWPAYVDQCAEGAANFIARFRDDPGALFNLTWADPE